MNSLLKLKSHLEDLLAPMAPVQIRRFFGGLGISKDGFMFGMVIREQLYFHVDERTRPRFAAANCRAFRYRTKVKEVVVESFHSVPDALFDEPDEFLLWARDAFDAAAAKKRQKKRRNGPDAV